MRLCKDEIPFELEGESKTGLQGTWSLRQIKRMTIGREERSITLGQQIGDVYRGLKTWRQPVPTLNLLTDVETKEGLIAEGSVRIYRRDETRWLPTIRCAYLRTTSH